MLHWHAALVHFNLFQQHCHIPPKLLGRGIYLVRSHIDSYVSSLPTLGYPMLIADFFRIIQLLAVLCNR